MDSYIKQTGTKNCGFTSLKMLLASIHKDKKYLFYPEFNKNCSLSLNELIKIGEKNNVFLKGYYFKDKNLFINKKNNKSLVLLKICDKLHLVFLKKIFLFHILVYDPEYGKMLYSKKEFLSIWNGEALIVKSYKKTKFNYKVKNKYKLQDFFIYFLVLISYLLLMSSLYIFNNSNFENLSILLFIFYFIFNILLNYMVSFLMKKIDKITNKVITGKKNIKEGYRDLINFKANYFKKTLNFATNFMNLICYSLILIINSSLNVLFIAILLLFNVIYYFFINNKINKESLFLSIEEFNLFEKEITNKEKTFNSINKKVNKIIILKKIFPYLTYFFAMMFSFLICFIYKYSISLNFFLFNFFSYIFINNSINSIFINICDSKNKKYYFSLINYYENYY